MGAEEPRELHGLSCEIGSQSRRTARIAVFALLLAGPHCAGFMHPAAETAISVEGAVANVPAEASCTLNLYTADGSRAAQATVTPAFRRTLVVAPGEQKYSVHLSCAGHSGEFRSPLYDRPPERRNINVGMVLLK
jgi:hypothetical protein